jgi:hypothetical protein
VDLDIDGDYRLAQRPDDLHREGVRDDGVHKEPAQRERDNGDILDAALRILGDADASGCVSRILVLERPRRRGCVVIFFRDELAGRAALGWGKSRENNVFHGGVNRRKPLDLRGAEENDFFGTAHVATSTGQPLATGRIGFRRIA